MIFKVVYNACKNSNIKEAAPIIALHHEIMKSKKRYKESTIRITQQHNLSKNTKHAKKTYPFDSLKKAPVSENGTVFAALVDLRYLCSLLVTSASASLSKGKWIPWMTQSNVKYIYTFLTLPPPLK